ncbi:hypothetical protein KX721_14535 [Klebsiella quasipneumoniae]|uniref:hypothetical protein n=1 Tax=Klebsiella quasipneumoniae TaxID=1463165 RepID=UPI001CA3EA80|nr:hypothetical protein [Klebsiella quasipneumoniae]MBY8385119.1 hypothetical protein [Klebsiella quasipneumoniae]
MNEQANKILVDLLQKASNGIDAAVSFSQAQIPDVIHQLLVWNFTKSLVLTLFMVLTIPFVVKFAMAMLRRQQDGVFDNEGYSWDRGKPKFKPTLIWQKDGDLSPLTIIFGFAIGLYVAILLGVVADMTWLKIWLAPKLYLIEYATSLVSR